MTHSLKTPSGSWPSWRQRGWRLAQRCVIYYLGIVVLLSMLQRQLLYVPSLAKALPVSQAGAPPNSAADITYRTDDGVELHGWHFLPLNETAQNQAEFDQRLAQSSQFVILFFAGNGGNRSNRDFDFQLMSRLPAHVIAFDYRYEPTAAWSSRP